MSEIQGNVTSRKAFSAEEFCLVHGISRSMFYKLIREGRGPRTMKVGTKTLVSIEAAEEWRRAMEAPPTEEPAAPRIARQRAKMVR